MNYVLISIGNIPDYIEFTINTILSVDKNAEIYVASDQYRKIKNVKIINLNDIESEKTKKIKDVNIYRDTIFDKNQLWLTSLLRIFYLRDLQNELSLKKIVHFDNDILIYKSFNKIESCFDKKKFNITPSSSRRLIFGYSFIPNYEIYNKICTDLEKLIILGEDMNWAFNNNTPPNEMDLLGMIYKNNSKLFNLLPNLPYDSNVLFDPSSYGQYIDGTHMYPKKFYSRKSINFNDSIGVELYSKRIRVKFKNYKPIVYWGDKEYELSNLHIHSKRLNKFLPKEYKVFN